MVETHIPPVELFESRRFIAMTSFFLPSASESSGPAWPHCSHLHLVL